MHAFQDALSISDSEAGARLSLAIEILLKQRKWVVLESKIAFCPENDHISCEVISSYSSTSVDGGLFEREYQNAQALFAASTLASALSNQNLQWSVVQDYGMGRSEVWRP